LRKARWNEECEEYLADYRKAFPHWFHEGKPRVAYDGRSFLWFRNKWPLRNPIEEQAKAEPPLPRPPEKPELPPLAREIIQEWMTAEMRGISEEHAVPRALAS